TNGIESPTGYAPRPPFQFSTIGMTGELGQPGTVRFHIHHGTTDFPVAMDLREGPDVLYNTMVFGGFSMFHSMNPTDRIFTLTTDDGLEDIYSYHALFGTQDYDGEL